MKKWENRGFEAIQVKKAAVGLDLLSILEHLAQKGVLQLLVEGGGCLNSSFLSQGLVDRLILYKGPKVIGSDGIDLFSEVLNRSLEKAYPFKLLEVNKLGETVKMLYAPS